METGTPNKFCPRKGIFVAFLLCVFATTASAALQPAVVGRLGSASDSGASGQFGLGATRRNVVEVAGLPDARVSGDIWIYYRCEIALGNSGAKNCDTLVIGFKQDRVVAMKLTDGNVLRDLLAQKNIKLTGPAYADLLR